MANTIRVALSGKRILSKIYDRLSRVTSITTAAMQGGVPPRRNLRKRHRVWVVGPNTSSDPQVSAGSHLATPIRVGEMCYRMDSDEAFICSRAPTANTAAAFIQLHA